MCLRDGQLNVQRCGYAYSTNLFVYMNQWALPPRTRSLGDVAAQPFRTHLLMVLSAVTGEISEFFWRHRSLNITIPE